MDDSLYVSDGSTEDGGKVRLKISDSFQTEIEKVEHVNKVENHLVYTNNPDSNMGDWNDNALIHKAYLKKYYPDFSRLRKKWEEFEADIIETIERLKIDLKQWEEDEDKKIEFIGDGFGKLNKDWEELKSDIKKIIEGDWQEWEKYKEEIKELINDLSEELRNNLTEWEKDTKKQIDEWEKNTRKSLEEWLLEELKKDKYRGPRGLKGDKGDSGGDYIIRDMAYPVRTSPNRWQAPTRYVSIFGRDWILERPGLGRLAAETAIISPLFKTDMGFNTGFHSLVLGYENEKAVAELN